jgi:hypothetical protein
VHALFALLLVGVAAAQVCGDCNGDGAVDVVDALVIAQAGVGLGGGGPDCRCDASGDGLLDVLDALLVAQEAVGLMPPLACPPCATGGARWSERFGGIDGDGARAVASDDVGNVYVTGFFRDTVDFGGGARTSAGMADLFLLKLDADGNHVWSLTFGDGQGQFGLGVASDGSGRVAVCGHYQGTLDLGGGPMASIGAHDAFVGVFDDQGNHVWSDHYGAASFVSAAVGPAFDSQGNLILVGHSHGSIDLGGGPLPGGNPHTWLGKFSPTGALIWDWRHAAGGTSSADQVVILPGDELAFTGIFDGSIDLGGGVITSNGLEDVFVARFDSMGGHVWSAGHGGAGVDKGFAIGVGPGDTLYLGGDFEATIDFGGGPLVSAGNKDVYVAKLDTSGNHLWSRSFGDGSLDRLHSIAVDGAGDVVLAGYFDGTIDLGGGPLVDVGGYDVFVGKLEASNGGHLWSERFGDGGFDWCWAACPTTLDRTIVVGYHDGTIDFGTGPLVSAGGYDGYIVQFER